MQSRSTANPYQSQIVEAADPVKLVELLYEGFIRFCRRAIEAIGSKDPEQAHNNILRAYAIVAELQATLDLEQGGSIASNLERCYDYVLNELKEADVSKSAGPLENSIRVIEPLLSAWKEAHSTAGARTQPSTFVQLRPDSGNTPIAGAPRPGAKPQHASLDTLG